jgi:hypothetical protein
MLHECGSPQPVLSTYPLLYEGAGDAAECSREPRATLLCSLPATAPAFGQPDCMLRFRARLLAQPPDVPLPTPFWAAGFSFAPSILLADVPYDPHLPFLFFGEETSMAVRMFTRGWDVFAPPKPVLYHRWERHYRPTFWQVEGGDQLKRESQRRVRALLTGDPLLAQRATAWEPLPCGPTGLPASVDKHPAANTPASARSTHRADAAAVDGLAAVAREAAAAAAAAVSGGASGWEAAAAAAMETGQAAAVAAAAAAEPTHACVWGAGGVRTLRQYEDLSGVDFRAMTVSERAEMGGLPSEDYFWDRFGSLEAMVSEREAAQTG